MIVEEGLEVEVDKRVKFSKDVVRIRGKIKIFKDFDGTFGRFLPTEHPQPVM